MKDLKQLLHSQYGNELELDALAIAEALWLGSRIKIANEQRKRIVDETLLNEDDELESLTTDTNTINKQPQTEQSTDDEDTLQPEDSTTLYSSDAASLSDTYEQKAQAFYAPAIPALPDKLNLTRAFKPLKMTVPSRVLKTLDEAATVQHIAETGFLLPAFKPVKERWLDVALVVDSGTTMALWQQTASEFHRFLESLGAFSRVGLWRLYFEQDKFQLYKGNKLNTPRSPAELKDITGRRLIIVLSDFIANHWRTEQALELLKFWGRHQPLSLLNMLPQRFWRRSSLGAASPVYLCSSIAAPTNHRLNADRPYKKESATQTLKLPVLTLESHDIKPWVGLLKGQEFEWVNGVVWQNEAFNKPKPIPTDVTAVERIQYFRATASPQAQELARYLAIVPLSLPVMRMVQRAMLPQSQQYHLAEVVIGGLLQTVNSDCNDDTKLEFEFYDGVGEILLDQLSPRELHTAYWQIESFIEQNYGHGLGFLTYLANPDGDISITNDELPIAKIGLRVLRRLGGQYSGLAKQLEKGIGGVKAPIDEDAEFEQFLNDLTDEEEKLEQLSANDQTPATKIASIVYQVLQAGQKITAQWLIKDLKAIEPDWFYNQKLFAAISERLNKLGCEPDESKQQFIYYLNSDHRFITLVDLVLTSPTVEIASIVYDKFKTKSTVEPAWFLAALKANNHAWDYEQALLVNITERLNQLSNQRNRSLTQLERSLKNDTQLISLLEQSTPSFTKKGKSTAIEASALGNIVHPRFKLVNSITAQWLLEEVKKAGLDWYYDEEVTAQITLRLNALKVYKDEDLEQFNQYLSNDAGLAKLLEQSPTIELKDVGQVRLLPDRLPSLFGRDELLQELMNFIIRNKSGDRHLLLRGTGGVGKSLVCQALAHRCDRTSKIKDILWINASGGLAHQLRNVIAPEYGIENEDPNWLKHLLEQLKSAATPSVMFIDNFDSTEGDFEEELEILKQLKQLHWCIITTSRSKYKVFKRTYTIRELNLKECIELFKHHYGSVKPEAAEMLEALIKLAGRHTLTIELLAKVGKKSHLPISRLFKHVKNEGFNLTNITTTKVDAQHSGIKLDDEKEEGIKSQTLSDSNTQWEVHQHLSKLFDFSKMKMSYKVVMSTLTVLPNLVYDVHDQLVPWLFLKDDTIIVNLGDRGWLENVDTRYRMHPVIGHVAKEEVQIKVKYLAKVAVRFNDYIKPKGSEHWISKANYVPYLLSMGKYLDERSVAKSELSFSLACIYQAQSEYYKAEKLFLKVLAIREMVYVDEKQEKVLDNLNHLSRLYRVLNEFDKAEQYSQRSLAISKRLGKNHIATAVAMSDLGSVYKLKGEYDKALELYKKVIEINQINIDENKLKRTSPHVVTSVSRIGDLLKSMKKYEEALPYYKSTLQIRQNTVGPEHVSYAAAAHDLGMLYQLLGEYTKAKELFKKALKINEETFGEVSHEVSEVLNSIGNLHVAHNNIQAALPLFEQSLNIKKRIFGEQHTKIAPTIESIANLHVHNHTLNDAVDFYMQALKIYQRFYGPEHVCVYKVLTELGQMYVRRRDVDWTEKEFWQHCNNKERFYGDDDDIIFVPKHHCVATAYYNEAQRYKNSPKKAIELHTKALELREELLPSTNNAIRQSLEAIIEVHTRENKPLSTLPYYEKIVDFLKRKHGEEDVVVGRYLADIAPTFQHQGKVDAAMGFYNQAIEIMEGELGHDDPLTKEMVKRRVQLRESMR